jgi:hypothetical protein
MNYLITGVDNISLRSNNFECIECIVNGYNNTKQNTYKDGAAIFVKGRFRVISNDRHPRETRYVVTVQYRSYQIGALKVYWPGGEDICAFSGYVSLLGLPEDFELSLGLTRPNLNGKSIRPLAAIKICGKRRVESSSADQISPVALCSFGRSGSTVAMQSLSTHPEISAAQLHPYELRYGLYLSQQYSVAASPADLIESWEVGAPNSPTPNSVVGRNPYFQTHHLRELDNTEVTRFLTNEAPKKIRDLNLDLINSFYTSLEGSTDLNYFIEKITPGWPYYLLREMYPDMKTVFLVRDFRDMVASIISFNKKRGTNGWGQKGEPTVEWIKRLGGRVRELQYLHENFGGISLAYEDLIRGPESAISSVYSQLGLNYTESDIDAGVKAILSKSSEHITSAENSSVHGSIGRWEKDLPDDIKNAVNSEFEQALNYFDYI